MIELARGYVLHITLVAVLIGPTPTFAGPEDNGLTTTAAGQRNLETMHALIKASSDEDLDTLLSLFTMDAVVYQPFQPSGPARQSGRAEIGLAYQRVFENFDSMRYATSRYTVSADGRTIFAELQGDFDLAGGTGEYDNFFVFRLDFDTQGRISALTQYQNSFYTAQVFARSGDGDRGKNDECR